MATNAELCEALKQLAGHFSRIDDTFLRSQHKSLLCEKGSQVSHVLNLVSENLPTSYTLRENIRLDIGLEKLITWLENWAQVFRISNISLEIDHYVSKSGELKNEENRNAVKFVIERLLDVDKFLASVLSKQQEAAECLMKVVDKDLAVGAAVKECKVFNYLAGWVAVDVEGCHRKLQLANDRIAACRRNAGVSVLQLLLNAFAVPMFAASTMNRDIEQNPNLLISACLVVLIFPLSTQDRMLSILSNIADPPIIKIILTLLNKLKQ